MTDERRISHRRNDDQCQDIGRMKQIILGNGTPGLAKVVEQDHAFLQQFRGIIGLFRWIGFAALLQLAGLIWLGVHVAKLS
ncbi:MAG TPA: hypothetical protein PKK12_11405, partial [Candidatus Aminicenantes bacterium]|nr:hypothetical protein [Candidatus Aminicenantes bacterium]